MSDLSAKALGEFLSEAQEIVESFNRNLLALDAGRAGGGRADPELVNDSFRAVHSIKGLAGLFGFDNMTRLAHHLENLLDDLRLGRARVHAGTLDLLFEAVELFGAGLAAAASGGDVDPERMEAYLARLAPATAAPAADDGDEPLEGYQLDPAVLSVLTEYEEHRLRENLRSGATIYRISGRFDLMAIDQGIEELKELLKPVGEIITYLPGGEPGDPDSLELDILVGSHEPRRRLVEVLAGIDVTVSAVPRSGPVSASGDPVSSRRLPAAPAPAAPEPFAAAEEVASLRSVSQSVRVDIRKLDSLMNVVGELGLVHAGLHGLLARLSETELVDETRKLRHEVRSLERKLAELQSGILEVRMVPLRQIFDKLSRVVRKVSRALGKEIRLEISGADTELDKLIVEELSDPLMHIIRNAIDHGIEPAAERVAAGKPEIGTIAVAALQQGNRVIVTVSDDGRGIDERSIAGAALERGLVERGAVADMSKRELLNLLFLPGMSTRATATELSGRGVGLDVVKTNIAKLSGIIDIASTPTVGTEVTMTLPITLAILQALLARVAGRTYAIPLNGVLESLIVRPDEVATIEGREVITLRNHTLRLARIEDIFALERPAEAPRPAQLFVIVIGVAQHRLGLVVDEVVGEQDIVIKSLGRALAQIPGVAGATELGGQQTVLVLDVPGLVEAVLSRSAQEAAA